jgi:hypothetical protein
MTPLSTLPVQNGALDVLQRVGPWVAIGIAGYWLFLLYRRTVRSSGDPSYRKFTSSRLGSASVLVSGAYMSAVVAVVVAVLSWPLPREQPLIALALVGLVAYHAALEYREADS